MRIESRGRCGSEMQDLVQIVEKKSGRGSEGCCGKLYFPKMATTVSAFLPHEKIKSNSPTLKAKWAYHFFATKRIW